METHHYLPPRLEPDQIFVLYWKPYKVKWNLSAEITPGERDTFTCPPLTLASPTPNKPPSPVFFKGTKNNALSNHTEKQGPINQTLSVHQTTGLRTHFTNYKPSSFELTLRLSLAASCLRKLWHRFTQICTSFVLMLILYQISINHSVLKLFVFRGGSSKQYWRIHNQYARAWPKVQYFFGMFDLLNSGIWKWA